MIMLLQFFPVSIEFFGNHLEFCKLFVAIRLSSPSAFFPQESQIALQMSIN